MKKKGIHQKELAEKIKVTTSSLSRSLTGDSKITVDLVKKLSKFFNVSPNFILGFDDTNSNSVKIPILGTVPAGIPIEAIEENQGCIYLPFHEAKKVDFGLTVKGDSMINANIFDGDIALVKESKTAINKQIVVARTDDGATVKRFEVNEIKNGEKIVILKAENPIYKDFVYKEGDDIGIIGVVTGLWRPEIK